MVLSDNQQNEDFLLSRLGFPSLGLYSNNKTFKKFRELIYDGQVFTFPI